VISNLAHDRDYIHHQKPAKPLGGSEVVIQGVTGLTIDASLGMGRTLGENL
jgi:hypothetical protein